jgi:hypothetical protein
MNPLPNNCPVCGGDLIVTRLHCPSCETSLDGSFVLKSSPLQEAFSPEQLRSLLPFSRLSQDQLYFILTFVRCEGRFNRMEEDLHLSYPTLRSRLDEIILALGYKPAPEPRDDTAVQIPLSRLPDSSERQRILDMLNRGEISVDEARRRLRGEPPLEQPAEPPQPSETDEPVQPSETIETNPTEQGE